MISLGLVAVGAGAAVGLGALNGFANRVVRPTRRLPDRSVPDTGLEHEDLTIPGAGGPLAGWYLRASGAARAPLVVFAHGWGASHGTVLRLAEPLAQAGFDVLLFDMRGHGRNAAEPYVTIRELRDDVASAVAYAAGRWPGRPLVLAGHSFGGAASVIATADGAPVAGLVLIATPSDTLRITAEYLTAHGMPGALIATLLRPFWWWRLGGGFARYAPVRRIDEVQVPMLLVQPELDERVVRRHADELSEAAGIPYHVVPEREHTDVLGAPLTLELVSGFLEAFD